jgi:hypothetical protein
MTKNQHGGILPFVLTQLLSRKPDFGRLQTAATKESIFAGR